MSLHYDHIELFCIFNFKFVKQILLYIIQSALFYYDSFINF